MRRTLFAIGTAALLLATVIAAPVSAAVPVSGGNPVTDRPYVDGYSDFVIVDRNNAVSGDGVLTEWSFFAKRAQPVQLVIVRSGEVQAASNLVTADLGLNTRSLNNLPVSAGDFVGIYVTGTGVVAFSGQNSGSPVSADKVVLYTPSGSGPNQALSAGVNLVPFEGSTDRVYSVQVSGFHYAFDGFFQPVDNGALNVAKAGSAIPVKFSLGGNEGLDIFKAGFPQVTSIPCDAGAPLDVVEETVTAGGSSLSYDPDTARYGYIWKTQKAWAGKCLRFDLGLLDESIHTFDVKFK